MFEQDTSFIDQALSGDALLFEIDDFVDRWHESDSSLPLHQYLGMTEAEYDLWLNEPDQLAHIVRARRDRLELGAVVREAINDNAPGQPLRVAARTDQTVKVERLKRWLEREGFDLS
jgi:hypothetical protein